MSAEIEFSESEVEVDVDAYKSETLPFGKYKGTTYEDMIRTPLLRGYLKYLLKWEELKPETRALINSALAVYNKSKPAKAKPLPTTPATKKKRRRTAAERE